MFCPAAPAVEYNQRQRSGVDIWRRCWLVGRSRRISPPNNNQWLRLGLGLLWNSPGARCSGPNRPNPGTLSWSINTVMNPRGRNDGAIQILSYRTALWDTLGHFIVNSMDNGHRSHCLQIKIHLKSNKFCFNASGTDTAAVYTKSKLRTRRK